MDTISLADLQSVLTASEDSFAASSAPPPPLPLPQYRTGDAIARGVRQALAAADRPWCAAERRREPRLPYPYPIYLTPLTPADQPLTDDTFVVIGKHLSDHGVDFYHREALPYRRVIASLDVGELGWIGLILELTWCRFTRYGWYDNGGRFLAVVPSPLAADV
jgi:hypothetical protein